MTRAPCGLLDSWSRFVLPDASRRPELDQRWLTLGQRPHGDEAGASPSASRMSNQVELRLTANLQLQPPSQLVTGGVRGWGPESRREPGVALSWWSLDRKLLCASPPDRGVFCRVPGL